MDRAVLQPDTAAYMHHKDTQDGPCVFIYVDEGSCWDASSFLITASSVLRVALCCEAASLRLQAALHELIAEALTIEAFRQRQAPIKWVALVLELSIQVWLFWDGRHPHLRIAQASGVEGVW
jgi:hypothetical protein